MFFSSFIENNFDSFFMTQTNHHQEEATATTPRRRSSKSPKSEKKVVDQVETNKLSVFTDKKVKYLESYETLLDIENEKDIKIPKGT
jgi:hypothetical protein